MSRRKLLLMDANVLIDFCDADATVIALISKHIGQVHVPRPILVEEVEQLIDVDWTELAITAVDPSLEVATEAATRPSQGPFVPRSPVLVPGARARLDLCDQRRPASS